MTMGHQEQVANLQKQMLEMSSQVCLAAAHTSSNTTRASEYKKRASCLDLSSFNQFIEVNVKEKQAYVQPRLTMYNLCKGLLKHKLLPNVVPEFKGITVGGAINGCGGESNSHKVGLFHNNCLEYELILANSERVLANKQNYADLFSAVHGSYGSLALLTSAKIALKDAPSFIRVTYRRFSDMQAAIAYMKASDAQFLEGIIYSKEHALIIEGRAEDEAKGYIVHLSKKSAPWFYTHAREQKNNHEEYVPILDYLFRHDRGAFWMGAYLIKPVFLAKFFSEGVWKLRKAASRKATSWNAKNFATICDPNLLLRCMTASLMQSQTLYKLLHKGESWVNDRFIIQDFTLPESKAVECINFLFEKCPIFPLWLCPVQKNPQNELFCPSSLNCSDLRCLNIGIYGLAASEKPAKDILSELEDKLLELGGRKWLYTNSEYTKEKFWQIYPQAEYSALRNKYYSNRCFINIEDKVLNN